MGSFTMEHTDGLTIPFTLRGFKGAVTVRYGPNTDPEGWGFGLLDLPFDLELVRGFPVCEARIKFSRPGYYAFMGWLQLVTAEETQTGETWVSVDTAPNVHDLEVPFSDFGHLPTMFDAPGPNPPRTDETWLAETFLVACPDVARTRTIGVVSGFHWGYRIESLKPTLLPAEVLTLNRWNDHLSYLSATFPSWTFVPST